MKTLFKAALAALALAGASAAMTAPAAAQGFGIQVGPRGGIGFSYDSGGYCDVRGCPDDFWNLPVYYGSVFYDGRWFEGPVYYRNWYGRRQYWIYGSWHEDQWRGPRPGWYREGRYGPALGMNYYRDNGFRGRWERDRGNYRNFDRRDDFRNDGRNDRRDFGRDNDRRDNDRRDDRRDNDRNGFNQGRGAPQNAVPDPQQQQQQQNGFRQGRGGPQNAAPAPAPQAAPPAPPPAPPADNGRGNRGQDGPRPDRSQWNR